jgi:hypothetical protein
MKTYTVHNRSEKHRKLSVNKKSGIVIPFDISSREVFGSHP